MRYAEANPALCVFELIYFARPDSYMEGRNLYEVRRRMGEQLAIEHPVEADLVMPVPDTGAPAAAGYAEASGLPYREGMYRNRYAGRTFIQPSQGMRHRGRDDQAQPAARGRGRQAADRRRRLDRAGHDDQAHRRAAAQGRRARGPRPDQRPADLPPVLLRHRHVDRDRAHRVDPQPRPQIREFIGADSLGYLSIRGVLAALDLPYDQFCFACFDGNYPEPVPYDAASRKFMLEEPVLAGGPWLTRCAPPTSRRRGRCRRRASGRSSSCAPTSTRPAGPRSSAGSAGSVAGSPIPAGYREPLLIASTDGVGTKTAIAAAVGRFDTIGIDLVAMCADDVVCTGAEPLAFLDYVAVGRLDPVGVAELVGSVAAGCRAAGAALVGGETAEHPGLMEADEFDLAGCCIGVVERARVIDGSRVVAGDAILGPGLVRPARQRLLARPRARRPVGPGPRRAVPGAPAPDARRRRDRRAARGRPARGDGDARRGAADPDPALRPAAAGPARALRAAGSDLHGLAHITGGGLPGQRAAGPAGRRSARGWTRRAGGCPR